MTGENAFIIDMVSADGKDNFAVQRLDMVHQQLQGRKITDQAVLDAMGQVPREEFIPTMYRFQAYADSPVPIGMGQTISQPYVIALMSQLLSVDIGCEVLEIGTGSGYQTAVLAKIAKKVYTIERLPELSEMAQAVLGRLGIGNVEFYIGDGSLGWPAGRTFDRIMLTAAVPAVPDTITSQLADNGVMVAPVGSAYSQQLVVFRRNGNRVIETATIPVKFVSLIGKYGYGEE